VDGGEDEVGQRVDGHLVAGVGRQVTPFAAAQDPEVIASPELREPVDETFRWLRGRLAGVIREGQDAGGIDASLDPEDTAATIAAVLQGGYVLARAADSIEPFQRATRGLVTLLRSAST
jgi:Tetracyclin repressor-like, C-terminal domain